MKVTLILYNPGYRPSPINIKGTIMLKEGSTAPAFKTNDANGETIALKDLRGQKVVHFVMPLPNSRRKGLPYWAFLPTTKSRTLSLSPSTNFLSHY
jgi:hypothetical protein